MMLLKGLLAASWEVLGSPGKSFQNRAWTQGALSVNQLKTPATTGLWCTRKSRSVWPITAHQGCNRNHFYSRI